MNDIKEILKETDIYDIIDFYGEQVIFNEIPSWQVVDYYNNDDLLEEMGFDPNYCFESYDDFIFKAEMEVEPDIITEYDISTMNEKDIFNRFFELLSKNKLTYQEWDKFLSEHE